MISQPLIRILWTVTGIHFQESELTNTSVVSRAYFLNQEHGSHVRKKELVKLLQSGALIFNQDLEVC